MKAYLNCRVSFHLSVTLALSVFSGLFMLTAAGDTPSAITVSSDMTFTASNFFQNDPTYGADKAFDGDPQTRWATDFGTKQAWLAINFGKAMTFAKVHIDEATGYDPDPNCVYKRVQSFELQYKKDDAWITFYKGTTIGPGFETPKLDSPVTAQEVRLNILDATEGPTISEVKFLK